MKDFSYLKKVVFCLFPITSQPAFGQDFWADDLSYSITSQSQLECKVLNCSASSQNVVIPPTVSYNNRTYTVKEIGDKAFLHKKIISITIPHTVRSIGNYAFSYCDQLTEIILPPSIKTIGYAAFNNCHKLQFVVIPSSITSIGGGILYNVANDCEIFNLSNKDILSDCPNIYTKDNCITFKNHRFPYTGKEPHAEYINNLKAYRLELRPNESLGKAPGQYTMTWTATFTEGEHTVTFNNVPYTYTIVSSSPKK